MQDRNVPSLLNICNTTWRVMRFKLLTSSECVCTVGTLFQNIFMGIYVNILCCDSGILKSTSVFPNVFSMYKFLK